MSYSAIESNGSWFKKLIDGVRQAVTFLLIELPAKSRGMDRLIAGLEESGQSIVRDAGKVSGRPGNLETLAHIIGIERWGHRRLHVALGEPLMDEEHDGYRPPTQSWPELVALFQSTSQETVSLGKTLRMAGVDRNTRVSHNQFGGMSLLGWLFYLNLHALIESKKIH